MSNLLFIILFLIPVCTTACSQSQQSLSPKQQLSLDQDLVIEFDYLQDSFDQLISSSIVLSDVYYIEDALCQFESLCCLFEDSSGRFSPANIKKFIEIVENLKNVVEAIKSQN